MTTRTQNNTAREVAEFLKTLNRVAITTHVGADGDAIGASAALLRLMRALGAAAIFCHAEEVPSYLRWLLPEEIFRELPEGHDLLVVDTSRPDRTGVPIPGAGARLNLDHHEDNPLTESTTSSTPGLRRARRSWRASTHNSACPWIASPLKRST